MFRFRYLEDFMFFNRFMEMTMPESTKSLTHLGDIIAGIMEDGTIPFNPEDAEVWNLWDDVIGPVVSRHATPSWIKQGVLRVAVSDPIWLQELRFSEADIRARLNARMGRESVSRIEFRVGPE